MEIEIEIEIKTEYWPKPIPVRKFDWEAWEEGSDEDSPVGQGATEKEAIEDLLYKIDNR